MRVACEIVLTDNEQLALTSLVHSKLTSVRLAQRARIVLLAASGTQCQQRHRHTEWLKFLKQRSFGPTTA